MISWDINTPGYDGPSHCLIAQAEVTPCMLIKWFDFFFLNIFINKS